MVSASTLKKKKEKKEKQKQIHPKVSNTKNVIKVKLNENQLNRKLKNTVENRTRCCFSDINKIGNNSDWPGKRQKILRFRNNSGVIRIGSMDIKG